MGKFAKKTAYKKLLKEEKAKTKLKVSHKTVLPKGQNVTKTTFKVKKIVIKSQLREHEGEVVSKSNLNVKVIISSRFCAIICFCCYPQHMLSTTFLLCLKMILVPES